MKRILCSIILATTVSIINYADEVCDSVMYRKLQEVIVVESAADKNLNSLQIGSTTLSASSITAMPVMFGEPDIVKSLQQLPGVSQGVEGFTGLYVRGGDNDQNLFLYEGLPLYNVSHLGGVFSSFNVATIDNIDFYKCSFPTKYGGRISSITDINMNEPNFDKFSGRLSIGLISGNAYISGPIIKEKTAFSVGLRRSWIDLISIPTLAIMNSSNKSKGKKSILHYAFTDFNARIDHKFNSQMSMKVIGYYGHDKFKTGEERFPSSSFNPSLDSEFAESSINNMSWGNWGVLGNWRYNTSFGLIYANAYYTSYSSSYRQEYEYQKDISDPSTFTCNYSDSDNKIDDIGVSLHYDESFEEIYRLQIGTEYIHHNYMPEKVRDYIVKDEIVSDMNNGNPQLFANEVSAYIDNTLNFNQNIALNIGLRGVSYHICKTTYNRLEPRASIKIKISDDYSIKGGYSRMNQFVQQISNNYISLPTDLWQPITDEFAPMQSDQYAIGVYGNLPYKMYFSIEGWYKDMKNVLEYKDGISPIDPNMNWDDKLTSGKGWAYGTDINLTMEGEKLSGSIGYGLMWNWRKFEDLNNGNKFPAKFDNRHKININASYKLNKTVEFNAGWTFMTGNRVTLSLYNYEGIFAGNKFQNYPDAPGSMFDVYNDGLDYYSQRNNIRMPAYHRLDLSVNINKELGNGRKSVWSFGLYNAYCHMNPMTITKGYVTEGTKEENYNRRAFETYSMIPIIPSVAYTYIF